MRPHLSATLQERGEPSAAARGQGTRAKSARRAGFLLGELLITVILLAVAMTVAVRLVGWVALEQRAAERRERALMEASNLLERLAAARAALSPAAQQALPGAELKVEVTEVDSPLPAKRLRVQVRWRDRSGGFEAPIRLTTWVYRPGREKS
jgi:type II secretory pathway pseudopilin PulG